jgi:hypothetical protein
MSEPASSQARLASAGVWLLFPTNWQANGAHGAGGLLKLYEPVRRESLIVLLEQQYYLASKLLPEVPAVGRPTFTAF